jgi:hypothetical protein
MNRPHFNDEMFLKLAEKAASILGDDEPGKLDLLQIKEILEQTSDDGFELGKAFEELDYHIDAQIVEELDDLRIQRNNILRDFIENWVIENDIKPLYKVGDAVKINRNIHGTDEYKIKRIETKIAQYIVHRINYESMGVAINYEDVLELL